MNMNLTKFKRIFCLGLILGQLILMLGCSNFFHRHEKPNDKVWNITYFQYFDTVSNIYSYAGDTEEEFSKKISTRSGGQKTRVALGKLLLQKPDLIILDEPARVAEKGEAVTAEYRESIGMMRTSKKLK